MRRILKLLGVIALFAFLIYYCFNNFFSERSIVGKYVNRNFYNSPPLPEIPSCPDTLTLFENNRFYSKYWGNGSYKINTTIGGTEITLFYGDKFGEGALTTVIKRLNFGKPKIILSFDQNRFYQKLD